MEQWFKDRVETSPVNIYGRREDDLGKERDTVPQPSQCQSHRAGWTYTVTVKTQAVLPAQKNLRGKIFLSIFGDQGSLSDPILSETPSTHQAFHAGGEDVIELKSSQRLGEVNATFGKFADRTCLSVHRTFTQSNYGARSPNGNRGCANLSRSSMLQPHGNRLLER